MERTAAEFNALMERGRLQADPGGRPEVAVLGPGDRAGMTAQGSGRAMPTTGAAEAGAVKIDSET